MNDDALRTAAGKLLYHHLPEEYRYRDNPVTDELGDLEAYLHGFGHLMDLFRGTLEQAYADGFAEMADNGRRSQTWVLPYLASLLGTGLIAPDLDGTGDIRRAELGHTVNWSKGKGTLRVADSTADVMADAETHVVEGWRRMAVSPRLTLPPFSLPREAGERLTEMMPLGTPDMRRISRPEIDDAGTDPLQSFRLRSRDENGHPQTEQVFWKRTSRDGAPCFANSYADISVTTPDIRTSALEGPGPAPRRVTVFVQPTAGFFEPGIRTEIMTTEQLNAFADEHPTGTDQPVTLGPAEILEVAGITLTEDASVPDRIALDGGFTVEAGRNIALNGLNISGPVIVETGGWLEVTDCAVHTIDLRAPADDAQPSLVATNCLLAQLKGPAGFARLEYVTVMFDTQAGRLQASDCIFVGPFDDPTCFDAKSCVRYSRLPRGLDPDDCVFARARSNTADRPRFVRRPIDDGTGSGCEIREAVFGEAGAGVLDHAAPLSIREGSEDGMEMGTYHARGHAARLSALERKLADQLPLGQTLSLRHDPMLAIRPPSRAAGAPPPEN